jgi:hypothetical protein
MIGGFRWMIFSPDSVTSTVVSVSEGGGGGGGGRSAGAAFKIEIGGSIPPAGGGAAPDSPSALRFARAFSFSSSRSSAPSFTSAMVFFAGASGFASAGAADFTAGFAPRGGSAEPSFLGARFFGASSSLMRDKVSAFFAGAAFVAGGGVTTSSCPGAAPLGFAARVPGLVSGVDFEVGLGGMEKVKSVGPCVCRSGFVFAVV